MVTPMVITAFYEHLLLRLYLVTVVVNLGGLLDRIKWKISRWACLYPVFLTRSSAVKRSMLTRYCIFQWHRGDRKDEEDTSVAPCLSVHLPIAFLSCRQTRLLCGCHCCCLPPLTLGPRLFSLQMRTDDKELSRHHWGSQCYTKMLRHSALRMVLPLSSVKTETTQTHWVIQYSESPFIYYFIDPIPPELWRILAWNIFKPFDMGIK